MSPRVVGLVRQLQPWAWAPPSQGKASLPGRTVNVLSLTLEEHPGRKRASVVASESKNIPRALWLGWETQMPEPRGNGRSHSLLSPAAVALQKWGSSDVSNPPALREARNLHFICNPQIVQC